MNNERNFCFFAIHEGDDDITTSDGVVVNQPNKEAAMDKVAAMMAAATPRKGFICIRLIEIKGNITRFVADMQAVPEAHTASEFNRRMKIAENLAARK